MKISRKMRKMLLMVAAMALVLGLAIGGTIAYLLDTTNPVENVFTTSDVSITLTETTGNTYQMIPGHTITKNPKVAVVEGSETSWLFVKIDKVNNFDNYMTFAIAEGWTALPNVEGVYYRGPVTAGSEFPVLDDNTVTVKDTVTVAMMETAKTAQPKLTFTAYATQYFKTNNTPFTVTEAWNLVKPN